MIIQTRHLYFLVAFLIAANVFDVIATCRLMQNPLVHEANPIVEYLMGIYGCYIGPILLKAPALLLLLWLIKYKQTDWSVGLIITAATMYAILVVYQLLLLSLV